MKKRISVLALLLTVLLLAGAVSALAEENAGQPVSALIWMDQQNVMLIPGKNRTINVQYDPSVQRAGSVTEWKSSDEQVATVNGFGSITAVGRGKAVITCTVTLNTGDVLRAESAVEVIQPVERIVLEEEGELQISFGSEVRTAFRIEPADANRQDLEWTAEDPEVVQADADGTIHGLKAGRTRVTARAADGYGANVTMEVLVSSVEAETQEVTLETPEEVRIPVRLENRADPESGEEWDPAADYQIRLEGRGVRWTTETEGDVTTFVLRPEAMVEETRLIIQDKQFPQFGAEILIHVAESAICDAQKLPVVSAQLLSGTGALTYQLEMTNNADAEIGEVGFLVDYRDQFGDTHYLYSNTDGTLQNYQYVTTFNIQPGETRPLMGRTEAFRSDDLIKEVRLAVYYYRFVETGKKVYIPDSELFWFSTKKGEMPRPEKKDPYLEPEVEITDKAERISYNLYATMCDLYSYAAKPFCRSYHSGKYVAQVGKDGWAEGWGLIPQDVIYGADEWVWEDDPFFLNRALARFYDGEKVTLKVVRNGEEIEIPIEKEKKE